MRCQENIKSCEDRDTVYKYSLGEVVVGSILLLWILVFMIVTMCLVAMIVTLFLMVTSFLVLVVAMALLLVVDVVSFLSV